MTYQIVRFFQNGEWEIKSNGYTLEDAKEWCNDPASHGDGWFDGFEQED